MLTRMTHFPSRSFGLSFVILVFASGCTTTIEQPEKAPAGKDTASAVTADAGPAGATGKSACEQTIDWANHETVVCDDCKAAKCAPEVRALSDVASSCESQYSAAVACNTCGCAENAITNKALCKEPWDAYITCIARSCESPCK
jgi:hypothetical protein